MVVNHLLTGMILQVLVSQNDGIRKRNANVHNPYMKHYKGDVALRVFWAGLDSASAPPMLGPATLQAA